MNYRDQCQYFHSYCFSSFLTSSSVPGEPRSSEGMWDRLSQVAVKGAEHDSRERLPHSKCLEGTRIDLLDYIHGLLDDGDTSRIIWLHGTVGVGKDGRPENESSQLSKLNSRDCSFSRASTRDAARLVIFSQRLPTSLPSIFLASGMT